MVGPIRWRSREVGGLPVEVRPLSNDRRAALGFPATGSAWELELAVPARGRIELQGRAENDWTGRGRLPLLTLPRRFRTRGLVAIEVETSTRLKLDTLGLTPIDLSRSPSDSLANNPGEEASDRDGRTRRAAMFGYRSAGGRLTVETTRGEPDPTGGLVREASLVSQFFPGAGLRHRLTLTIAADTARSIELKMPQGVPVDRLRRDGQPVLATPVDGAFRVEILAAAAGRSTSKLTIDYRTPDNPRSNRLEPARLLPGFSLPCLSFVWEVVTSDPWAPVEATPGLTATDPRPVPSLTSKLLGFRSFPWSEAGSSPAAEKMLAELNQRASEIGEGEANLGDWLLKLDAGRWPLVVDRLRAGLGRVGPPFEDRSGPGRSPTARAGDGGPPADGAPRASARRRGPDHGEIRGLRSSGGSGCPVGGAPSSPGERFRQLGSVPVGLSMAGRADASGLDRW